MALRELELITEELKRLASLLRGETKPESRKVLFGDIQKLLVKIHRGGAQG